MRAIIMLENVVFVVPTPGEAAVTAILEGPKEMEDEEEELSRAGSKQSRAGSKQSRRGSIPVVENVVTSSPKCSRPGSAGGDSRVAMSEYQETLATSARSSG